MFVKKYLTSSSDTDQYVTVTVTEEFVVRPYN